MFIKSYTIYKNAGGEKPYAMQPSGKTRFLAHTDDYKILTEILQSGPYLIGVDGSGSSTGVYFYGVDRETKEKTPMFALNLTRSNNETFVEYRVCFRKIFKKILTTCKVTRVYYEEPVVDFLNAVPNLYSLRTAIEEILVEEGTNLPVQTKLFYVANGTWKKWLHVLAGDKAPLYPADAKEFARAFYLDMVELVFDEKEPALALDVTDAWGLVFASAPAFVGQDKAIIYESPVTSKLNA